MRAFGGDITCNSVLEEFTEFTLNHPLVAAGLRSPRQLVIFHPPYDHWPKTAARLTMDRYVHPAGWVVSMTKAEAIRIFRSKKGLVEVLGVHETTGGAEHQVQRPDDGGGDPKARTCSDHAEQRCIAPGSSASINERKAILNDLLRAPNRTGLQQDLQGF